MAKGKGRRGGYRPMKLRRHKKEDPMARAWRKNCGLAGAYAEVKLGMASEVEAVAGNFFKEGQALSTANHVMTKAWEGRAEWLKPAIAAPVAQKICSSLGLRKFWPIKFLVG